MTGVSHKLNRQMRLSSRAKFLEIRMHGHRKKGVLFDIAWIKSEKPKPCVAVIVSRKLGNAVRRNRIKRRMREVFRLFTPAYKHPFDMMIFPKSQTCECRFNELAEEYKSCLGSQKLL